MIKKLPSLYILSFFCYLLTPLGAAVEIPLDAKGAIINGQGTRETIGYVDIEKLFNEHPLTQRLKAEFQDEAAKRRKEIAGIQQSIDDMERVILSSTTEINKARADIEVLRLTITSGNRELPPGTTQPAVTPGTGAPAVLPSTTPAATDTLAILNARETELEEREAAIKSMALERDEKQEELVERIKQNRQELLRLEEKQSATVLADLYKVIEKIAIEESITVILNKNDVLYGQSTRDLTDIARQHLQGR